MFSYQLRNAGEGGHHDTLSRSFAWKVLFSTMSTMLFLVFIQICLYLVMSTPVLPLSYSSYHVLPTYVLPTVVPGTSKMWNLSRIAFLVGVQPDWFYWFWQTISSSASTNQKEKKQDSRLETWGGMKTGWFIQTRRVLFKRIVHVVMILEVTDSWYLLCFSSLVWRVWNVFCQLWC